MPEMRVFAPTGDSKRGLGSNHASIEPGLLAFHRLNDRVVLEGELRQWIPLDDAHVRKNSDEMSRLIETSRNSVNAMVLKTTSEF